MTTPDIAARIAAAARLLRGARRLTAFTGAGISAESGIPTFRGAGGLWNRHDPRTLEIDWFLAHPLESWTVIRDLFYAAFARAEPNPAHRVLAGWQASGRLAALITQNIDDLHQRAGSREVIELHGNSRLLACTRCGRRDPATPETLAGLPPRCGCGGLYKPDFTFFGEALPAAAWQAAEAAARGADVMLVIGSTGEVYPAASVPRLAAAGGASIVEINPEASAFTGSVSDLHLPLKAGEALPLLARYLDPPGGGA